jgi:hypothetical protein
VTALARRIWQLMFEFLMRTAPDRGRSLRRRGLTPNDSRALASLNPQEGRTMRSLTDEGSAMRPTRHGSSIVSRSLASPSGAPFRTTAASSSRTGRGTGRMFVGEPACHLVLVGQLENGTFAPSLPDNLQA